MHVLVTGATGFVGAAVVRALLSHGHTVVGLVRDRARGRPLEVLGASLELGEMERPETYGPLVDRVDAAVHAAQTKPKGRWSRRRIAAMHQSDALMTRTLARACLEQGKLLVYTSGAMVHTGEGDEWISEQTPLRPCLLAAGHAAMVAELSRQHREQGLKSIVITPGFVYGPGGLLAETVELLKRRRYRVIGDGTNHWGLVHVDDLAEAYALAIERGRPGENYFVSDDEPLRLREVIDRITSGLGLPRAGGLPVWVARLFAGFPLVEAITAPIRMRNEHIKRELGWTPRYRTFDEGLPVVLRAIAPELLDPATDR